MEDNVTNGTGNNQEPTSEQKSNGGRRTSVRKEFPSGQQPSTSTRKTENGISTPRANKREDKPKEKVDMELHILDVPKVEENESKPNDISIPVEKKKTTKRKSSVKKQADTTLIEMMLNASNMIFMNRKEFNVLVLSQEEIKTLAQPMANILDKYSVMNKVQNEYSDVVVLITALASIYIPKLIILQATTKKQKEVKPNEQARKINTSNESNEKQTINKPDVVNHVATNNGKLSDLIDPTI